MSDDRVQYTSSHRHPMDLFVRFFHIVFVTEKRI